MYQKAHNIMPKAAIDRDNKYRQLLQVLKQLEREKREISIQELADASGYKLSSIKTYTAKKLRGFVLSPTTRGRFVVKGTLPLNEAAFIKHMSQRSPALDVEDTGLAPRLLRRSLDAYFLALELYNRPIQSNRVEAFCIMMINAWELLLKVEIINSQGETALFYNDDTSKSIAIRDAIKSVLPNDRDPVRRNIEYLTNLRDKAIHLLIPELQGEVSRLFQASVFNYLYRYNKVTDSNLSSQLGTGLISLVIDPGQFSPDILKETYDTKTAAEISVFMEQFHQEESELSSSDFVIPIEYKLTLSKNAQQGDITLASGSRGGIGSLIEVPKDVDKTHPHRQGDAVREVLQLLQTHEITAFTSYDFQAILFKERVQSSKSSSYYYFIEKPKTHRYSAKLVEFIVEKVKADSTYLSRCRESYKSHLDKQKKSRKPR